MIIASHQDPGTQCPTETKFIEAFRFGAKLNNKISIFWAWFKRQEIKYISEPQITDITILRWNISTIDQIGFNQKGSRIGPKGKKSLQANGLEI